MGCFLETAKKRIHCGNNNNNKNKSSASKQQKVTTSSSSSSSSSSIASSATRTGITATTATTATTKTSCDDSIIFKNKDIDKDNNQQNPNKTYANIPQSKENHSTQALQEAARKTEENSEGNSAVPAKKNKQQLLFKFLQLRQKEQQQKHKRNNAALEVEQPEQQHKIERKTAAEEREAQQITTYSTPKNKSIDSRISQNTATSYCLYPRLKRSTTHDNSNSTNKTNKINNCCNSPRCSCGHHKLYSKKPPQQQLEPARYYAATYCQVAASAARNMAATMAAAASSTSNNFPEMLLHARNHLAAYLTQASNCFIENFSYCCAATSTTTRTTTTTTATAAAISTRSIPTAITAAYPVIKTKQREQHGQQQHRRHCWQRSEQQQQHQNRSKCAHFEAKIDGLHQQQSYNSDNNNNNNSNNENCDHSCNACSYDYSNYNNNNNSHNYYSTLRNSISFYAASSVILVLCYLTTTTSAAATNTNAASIDKHPIQGIDWSKFDESSSDKEILDLLLEKKRYDKRLLPPVNDEDFCCGLSSPDMAIEKSSATRSHNRGTLTVNVNVLLLSLASPDESSLKYEVEFLLNQQWNDPRLQYGNKSQYDYLNALHHHDNIWTPDTYFIMHGDFKDPIIPMHFALRIYRNGTITYAMRRHLILSCQGSLHIFPFDDPKCSFSMESISYEEAQIKYVWKNDEDTLRKSPSLTTLNAYLIKNQTTACDQNSWRGNYSCLRVDLIFTRDRAFYFTTVFIPGIILVTSSFITFWLEWNAVPARSMIGNYSCLQVELTFTRDRAYYFTTVFIPGIILVTSSFITFWLEWNAVPARVMIGVTTMLNFFTTSNGFRSTLPVVSNLTAMNVWDGVCMCFIYASLLEFVCVNYVGRKRPLHNVVYRPGENPVTQRLPAVLSRIGVILASPLEIIEREFHAALSSEKAAAGISSVGSSPPHTTATATPRIYQSAATTTVTTAATTMTRTQEQEIQQQHGSIIGAAVQHLRARSVKYRRSQTKDVPENIYMEPVFMEPTTATAAAATAPMPTLTVEDESSKSELGAAAAQLRRSHSMSTNTPPLILRDEKIRIDVHYPESGDNNAQELKVVDIDETDRQFPTKPPRKKTSRSTSPVGVYFMEIVGDTRSRDGADGTRDCVGRGTVGVGRTNGIGVLSSNGVGGIGGDVVGRVESTTNGDKRREASAPNEIVACTSCGGGNSPCTHSANNGCATETCFVQVRKKEPPHPIRVAKTIDVIARITFPTAYSIFLIFFFVHYKGFS